MLYPVFNKEQPVSLLLLVPEHYCLCQQDFHPLVEPSYASGSPAEAKATRDALALSTGKGSRLSFGHPPFWPSLPACTSASSLHRRRLRQDTCEGLVQSQASRTERRFCLSRTQRSREQGPVLFEPLLPNSPTPLSEPNHPTLRTQTSERNHPFPPLCLFSETQHGCGPR